MKVIVVVVRGLQAGMLSCYGNLWVLTPVLDCLAAQSIVYDAHFMDSVASEGVRRTWRSGCYHLPLSGDHPDQAGNPVPDLLASLRARQIPTRLVLDGQQPHDASFQDGWDEVQVIPSTVRTHGPERVLEAATTTLNQLADHKDGLLWVELATLFPPWNTPEEFLTPYFDSDEEAEAEEDEQDEIQDSPSAATPARVPERGTSAGTRAPRSGARADRGDMEVEEPPLEPLLPLLEPETGVVDDSDDVLWDRRQSSYAGTITWLDQTLTDFLARVEEIDETEPTVVIFTSDVGQNLGEHGVVGLVRPWLHQELLHIPLLIRLPGAAGAGRRVPAHTQHIDLAPTIADLFETPLPDTHGVTLLGLAQGEEEEIRPYAVAGLALEGGLEWCLRTPEWAFLLPVQPHPEDMERTRQLYAKPEDRWEVNNIVQHQFDLAENMEQFLHTFIPTTTQPGPLVFPPLPTEEDQGEEDDSEPDQVGGSE